LLRGEVIRTKKTFGLDHNLTNKNGGIKMPVKKKLSKLCIGLLILFGGIFMFSTYGSIAQAAEKRPDVVTLLL
jgi:hypothetical protein